MTYSTVRKGLILGIIILFVATSAAEGIRRDFWKASDILESDVIENTWNQKNLFVDPPEEEWNKTFGGIDTDEGWSVQATTDGGYIIAGRTSSYGSGGSDVWLIKTDSDGNEEWSKTYGGTDGETGYSVQQTSDGSYIITAVTRSYGAGSTDVWLIKTDSNGNEEWNKTFGGPNADYGCCTQQTSEDSYIVMGNTWSYGPGEYDIWLIKTDSEGNEEWNKIFGGIDTDSGVEFEQIENGGYIIIGDTYSFGKGSSDLWLIKTDSNGNEEWNKTFGGISGDYGRSVKQTTDGGYVMTGYTMSYGKGNHDVWLIKADSDGNEEWNKTFGGTGWESAVTVIQISNGGYIISGNTDSYGAGSQDVWLIKTDSDGNEEWNKTIGGISGDHSLSCQKTNEGGYIITGGTKSYGAGSTDVWLIKLEGDNQITINLIPSMDSFVSFYDPDDNFGDMNEIFVITDNVWGSSDFSFVKFDLSSIPPGSNIISASLELYCNGYNPPSGNIPLDVHVHEIIEEWDEYEITWYHRPNSNTSYYSQTSIDSTGWITWDVSQHVDNWIENNHVNYGFLIYAHKYVYYASCFYSREYQDSSLRPKLVITYSPPDQLPPNKPELSGVSYGDEGVEYLYSTNSTDPEDDEVCYRFNWDYEGGNDISDWTSWGPSNHVASLYHAWDSPGTYVVRSQAQDSNNDYSHWSDPIIVEIVGDSPDKPIWPSPLNEATNVHINVNLGWTGGDDDNEDSVYYEIYLGETQPPTYYTTTPIFPATQLRITYDLPNNFLKSNTKYYWQIKAYDNTGLSTTSQIWDFTTDSEEQNKYAILVAPVRGWWNINDGEFKHDIHEMRKILLDNSWTDENIIFLTRDDIFKQSENEYWIDGDATLENVQKALDAIAFGGSYRFNQSDETLGPYQHFTAAEDSDFVFIELCDHGSHYYEDERPLELWPDPRPNDETDSRDGTFCTYRYKNYQYYFWNNSHYYWDDEFSIKLDNIVCESLVLVVDACHSGEFIPDCNGDDRLIITSCSERESCGIGFYRFYDRIDNLSIDGVVHPYKKDGRISVEEAHEFSWDELFNSKPLQEPKKNDQITDDVYLDTYGYTSKNEYIKTQIYNNTNNLDNKNRIRYSDENVLINELYYADGNFQHPLQWVELYNLNDYDVDISGWVIDFGRISGINVFPSNTTIPSKNFIIITHDSEEFKENFETPENSIIIDDDMMGDNFGAPLVDSITLYNHEASIVDSIDYGGGPDRAPAVKPPNAIARYKGGHNTNQSDVDWYIETEPTSGSENNRNESIPPEKPDKPSGPTTGNVRVQHNYSTIAIDPDGHNLHYLFDWGDGTDSGWLGPFEASEICVANHSWAKKDNYEIKVKAKDTWEFESEWSDPLEVSMPKNKPFNINSFFQQFLKKHPNIFPML